MNPVYGIVVIGRNLGALVSDSLESAQKQSEWVVYVDSGSTDDSAARAREQGIPVVALDASQPYTAARGRNAGAQFLLRAQPALEFLLFLDGDCLLAEGFLSSALEIMCADADVAVVAGQRRERFPERSIYNRLAALEWQAPIGEIEYCGGDALVRVTGFQEVHGYNPRLVGGEESDLSLRLRRRGWKIWGIGADMSYHDARMMHMAQWWSRSVRTGRNYGSAVRMHGREPERHWVWESASIWFWGAGVWGAALGLAKVTRGASLGLLAGYPLLAARIYKRALARGWSAEEARIYALFCVLGKFPQFLGQLQILAEVLRGEEQVQLPVSNQVEIGVSDQPIP